MRSPKPEVVKLAANVPMLTEDIEDALYLEELRAKVMSTFGVTEAEWSAMDAEEQANGYAVAKAQAAREHAQFETMLRDFQAQVVKDNRTWSANEAKQADTKIVLAAAMKQILDLTIHNASGYEWEDGCHYDLNDPVTLRDEAGLPCPHESADDDAISRNSVLKILLKLGETV